MNSEPYHGNIVRKLFIAGAIIMILTYPYFSPFLPQRPAFIMTAIILLAVLAGLTDWKRRWTAILDIIISIIAVLLFEDHAILFVRTPLIFIFITDQILVLIFIAALYFSIRNLREMSLR